MAATATGVNEEDDKTTSSRGMLLKAGKPPEWTLASTPLSPYLLDKTVDCEVGVLV